MAKHHPKNTRIKHRYTSYLTEAKRLSPSSVDAALAAISQFEETIGYRDFAAFHIEQAKRFKRILSEYRIPKTEKPLSKATIRSRLKAVKAFFLWLADQPGYRSRLSYCDAEYFNLSSNDNRVATAKREQPTPTLDLVRRALFAMPIESAVQRRDRAVLAFTLLTGARDSAVASFRLKHVDLGRGMVHQDAREVRTKFRKTFDTFFFPVGEDLTKIIADWVDELRSVHGFGPDDPVFPTTRVGVGQSGSFESLGLGREPWKKADAIRRIFKAAFERVGLPLFHPHSIRRTLALLGEQVCKSPEAFKAWSQNLGHEQVLTTFTSYGQVSTPRQGQIIAGLRVAEGSSPASAKPDAATIQRVLDHLLSAAQ